MQRGINIVQQVNADGQIVYGYDYRLSVTELYNVFQMYFPNVKKIKGHSSFICSEYNGIKYLIRTKNITYLGNPHKYYKKRYQIPSNIKDFYLYAIENGYCPLIIGVYTYDDLTLFVDFSIESYIGNNSNNSSAHVHTSDLQQVLLYEDEGNDEDEQREKVGYYEKVDIRGNRVTVFDTESVIFYLQERNENKHDIVEELQDLKDKLEGTVEHKIGREYKIEVEPLFDTDRLTVTGNKLLPNRTRNIILNYFASINKRWNGVECYQEMLDADFRNKNQSEWPGFYLEYSFEKYLEENEYLDYIYYAQDKVAGGVDLDLYLKEMNTYGDLKAHTIEKKDIPGNKKETIESVLKESGRVVYIVCVHETERDLDHGLEVTHFWNANKTNRKPNQKLNSYCTRMKNRVILKKVEILSIDSSNVQYLKGFTQGKNSNGKSRKVKIMIDGDKIGKFIRLSYEI